MTLAVNRARAAFTRACALDVLVRKPGNVSVQSSGHGMDAAVFLASAAAAADPLCAPGARVGLRIEGGVQATWAVAGCNTNLGILLLCAPLALAVEQRPQVRTADQLRAALIEVLADLDQEDARATYRGIAHANPGGLGTATDQDVHEVPSVDLRAAMALAADRDSIALQYVDGYALVFDVGVTALGAEFRPGVTDPAADPLVPASAHLPNPSAATTAAVQRAYLALLAAAPDSHIARKRGVLTANAVMQQALTWQARARAGAELDADPGFAAWDAALKAEGINPGTTADLLAASMMVAGLIEA